MKTRRTGISSRLTGRFFILVWGAFLLCATGAKAEPVKTLVQDTLYRADGNVAHGRLTIRWNAFSTSAGEAVAAGEMTVSTDVNGAISIPLIPNAGSNPAGTYYKVVIKLDDGTTSEEQWVVPTTSPTTVAAIRAKVVPQAVAAQFVTEQQFFGLATVASTGNYNDLLNKPTLTFNASAPGPIGGTTPSTVNATAVTAQSVNGVLNAATFAGADASVKVNACIAAVIAAGGGTCDASTLGGTQVMGQQINLGNTSLYDSKIVAKLILPAAGAWKWSLTDGVSCGIYQYSNTIIEGTGDVSGALAFTLDTANSATNMDSLYCTDKSPTGGGSYVKATGFDVSNTGAGTLVNGVVDVRYIFDESKFDHIIASNPTGDAWHITSVCCGTTFDQIAGFGSTTPASTGGTPLTVAQGAAFSIKNSSFNGPGIGKHNIYVVGGSNPVTGASFENVYMEKYGATDLGTSMVYVDSNVNGVSFKGGRASTGCTSTGCSQVIFENHAPWGFSVRDFGVDYQVTAGAINDVANGRTWPSDGVSIVEYVSDENNGAGSSDVHGVPDPGGKTFQQGATSDHYFVESTSGPLQTVAGTSVITPTTVGCYRILNDQFAGSESGTVDLSTVIDGKPIHDLFDFAVSGYNANGSSLNMRTLTYYGSTWGPVSQIEASTSSGNLYLDVCLNDVTTPQPVTAIFYGQSIWPTDIVAAPVVGAMPGTTSTAIFSFSGLNPAASRATTGIDQAAGYNGVLSAAGYSGSDICAKITAAINALPSTGGEIDLRGLNGVQAACASGIDLSVAPVTLRLGKATYTLGGALIVGPYSKIKGAGKTASGSVIQFSSALGSTTDAITMQWAGTDNNMTTAEIDDVYINPQGYGQDALRVRGGRNWKVNVEIENAGRDCLVIGGDQASRWTEQATVDADIFGCGRYGMRLDTSAGTSNYITHLTFPHLHIGPTTSDPIYVNMSSGATTSSSGIQEVSFQDIHVMSSFGTGNTTDAIYFACAGGTNNYAAYWNFQNGEIENGLGNSGYILNGQTSCMQGAVFGNMWLDPRWGSGVYNSATIAAPTVLNGQYANMAGVEIPNTFGIRFDGATANHTNDLFQTNLSGGAEWLFGQQGGTITNGGVTIGSAYVFNSGATQMGVICPSQWAGSGSSQQFACIGGGQDTGNVGPKWFGFAATGSGGNSAPLYLTSPVWTIDHTGKATFNGGLASGTTTATAAPLNNSTALATTAYADAAVGVETSRAQSAESTLTTSVAGKAASNASATVNGVLCGLGASCTVADSTKIPASWIASTTGVESGAGYTGSASPLIPTISGGDEVWEVMASAYLLTPGTAGELTVVLNWTDGYGTRTSNVINYTMPFATAGGTAASGAIQIHVKSGTAVTWSLNNNSPAGSWSYQLDITAMRKL